MEAALPHPYLTDGRVLVEVRFILENGDLLVHDTGSLSEDSTFTIHKSAKKNWMTPQEFTKRKASSAA